MPHPITFLIAVVILTTTAIVFVLMTPEARLLVERFPTEVIATVGASAGAIIVLLTIALAETRRRRRGRDDWAAARDGEARTLAAALRGEMTALAQWLAAEANTLEASTQGNPIRSNLAEEELDLPSMAARIVYEANAARLALLGPELAAAIAYCHTCFERAETAPAGSATAAPDADVALLRATAAKFDVATGYLDRFVAGEIVDISPSDRETLFAP